MIRIDETRQGPTGVGQGGWAAHRFQQAIGEPVAVSIKAPIPLDEDLVVSTDGQGWKLAPAAGGAAVLTARRGRPDIPATPAVSVADAALAGRKFPTEHEHPVPFCFSCGHQPDSMKVQSGPLGDQRWATDWTVPWWAGRFDDDIDHGSLWAAIDCAQAWYVSHSSGLRNCVTVEISVEVHFPLRAGETYAVVSWNGDYDDKWDGRKRGACGAIFDTIGRRVASSRTFWVALE